MGLFDTLIAEMGEPDREAVSRYPKVKEEIERLDGYVNRWEDWRSAEWDDATGMTRSALTAIRHKDEEIEALKALQGDGMNWDEIKGHAEKMMQEHIKEVKDELGRVSKVKQGDSEIPVNEYIQNVERGFQNFYGKTSHLPLKYYKEFGSDDYTNEKLLKFMAENKEMDPERAYERFVAPKREELAKTAKEKSDKEYSDREEALRKREEHLREAALSRGSLPLDDSGPAPEMTALQRRINDRKKVETPNMPKLTPGQLGEQVAAGDAYQAYLRDQASGNKPTVQ